MKKPKSDSSSSLGDFVSRRLQGMDSLPALMLRTAVIVTLGAFAWHQLEVARGPCESLPLLEENPIPFQSSLITRALSTAHFAARHFLWLLLPFPLAFDM